MVAVLPWRSLSGGRSRLSGGALGGKVNEKQQGHCGKYQLPWALTLRLAEAAATGWLGLEMLSLLSSCH